MNAKLIYAIFGFILGIILTIAIILTFKISLVSATPIEKTGVVEIGRPLGGMSINYHYPCDWTCTSMGCWHDCSLIWDYGCTDYITVDLSKNDPLLKNASQIKSILLYYYPVQKEQSCPPVALQLVKDASTPAIICARYNKTYYADCEKCGVISEYTTVVCSHGGGQQYEGNVPIDCSGWDYCNFAQGYGVWCAPWTITAGQTAHCNCGGYCNPVYTCYKTVRECKTCSEILKNNTKCIDGEFPSTNIGNLQGCQPTRNIYQQFPTGNKIFGFSELPTSLKFKLRFCGSSGSGFGEGGGGIGSSSFDYAVIEYAYDTASATTTISPTTIPPICGLYCQYGYADASGCVCNPPPQNYTWFWVLGIIVAVTIIGFILFLKWKS